MAKPKLILMTHGFPFDNSEASFIGPELEHLYNYFEIPFIFSLLQHDQVNEINNSNEISNDTEVVIVRDNKKYALPFAVKVKFYFQIFTPWFFGFIIKALKHKIGIDNAKIQISQFLKYLHLATLIHEKNKTVKAGLLYSYWFGHWNVAAGIYKELYSPKIKIVSRAHRYEIDINTYVFPFFPFRKFQMKQTDLVCFISSTWRDFIKNKFPKQGHKLVLNRLGARVNKMSPVVINDNSYHILTISGNSSVKRMELQLNALKLLDLPITWHHFGGKLEDALIPQELTNSKVKYMNYGFKQSKILQDWLANNFVHFLINTSISEGIPVSMMECLACGIPIIGTNVGGVSELINEKTGVLISADITAEEFAVTLKNELLNYQFDLEGRKNIIQFFEENYSATRNYNDFCTSITQT